MNEREFDIAVKGLHKTLKRTPMVLVTPEYLNDLEQKLEAIEKRLNEATGGEFSIKSNGKEAWVKYDSAMRYYHAVCDVLSLLEVKDDE